MQRLWPFRRAPGLALETNQVVEYLLLSRDFPRAVLFCVNRCLQSVGLVGDAAEPSLDQNGRRPAALPGPAERRAGISESATCWATDGAFLDQLLARLNAISADMARTYFNTRVMLADERPRQQQQQQQQG